MSAAAETPGLTVICDWANRHQQQKKTGSIYFRIGELCAPKLAKKPEHTTKIRM